MEEKEVKFLDIDPDLMEEKLNKIGAKKIFEILYKRRVFDYPDYRLNKTGAWLRVRDEGEKVTLSYKRRIGMELGKNGDDKGMEEVEVEVSDFDEMCKILLKSGLIEKHYAENKRIRYTLDDIEFDIDFWPQLKLYLEIEAPLWESVDRGISILGLNPNDAKRFSTHQVYKLAGINCNDYKIFTFDRMVKKDTGSNH